MVTPLKYRSVTTVTDLGGFETCNSRKFIRKGKIALKYVRVNANVIEVRGFEPVSNYAERKVAPLTGFSDKRKRKDGTK